MSSGKDAGARHHLDEELAKALSHPLRRRILQHINDSGVASPSEVAQALREPLANVSYHVRILRELNCVELVRTGQRRGAVEHHYRATATPWLDDERWAKLTAAFRRTMLGRTVGEIFEQASKAGRQGGFDAPEAYVSHIPLTLDEQGCAELNELLVETLEAARRIDAGSARRHGNSGPDAPPTVATQLAILHFRDTDVVQSVRGATHSPPR
jgi:DNA-binding transcriptional ArsR family regulator